MLRCNNIGFQYNNKQGIFDLSLSLDSPGLTALIGRNGAGKTTLLDLICGRKVPAAGTISVNGKTIDPERDVGWKRQLGFCPSGQLFAGMLSVRENYEMISWLRCGSKKEWQKIRPQLELFGCGKYLDQPSQELSAGQLRRAMILSVLIGSPKLVILDEPGNDLDIEGIYLLRQLLATLTAEHIVLVSTNILDVIRESPARAVFLEGGRLVHDSLEQKLQADALEKLYRDIIWLKK
ncbi:MAG: ABC transporter ATP-binding protein [Spirochaetes bacterium]|nr:ABC transporter ATP-binding protein [Spirochaetota bacterium]MBU0956807.1 ABC transporter ATP-binding protein [Spirochaetota bacterium]